LAFKVILQENRMSFISHIGTAVPQNAHLQADILKFMLEKTEFSNEERRMVKLMYGMSGISTRHSVLPDFAENTSENILFAKDKKLFDNVEDRLNVYDEHAAKLAISAINDAKIDTSEITHLITISCTGMSAPGLDIVLVKELRLNPEIYRTSINFMGCYAAIHGLKQADAIARSEPEAKVLVVSVELCTLHFQEENRQDYITSNLLFADGAACFQVNSKEGKWRIDSFYSKLYLEAENSMAWHVNSKGFLMKLDAEVPDMIFKNIKGFVDAALDKCKNIETENISWLIHPGGRKILEATARALALKNNDLDASFKILKNYGNMSSATLIFILKEMFDSEKEHLFMAGFGPGITMESAMLTRV
jgi:predicted naringenin-chalcone synthase